MTYQEFKNKYNGKYVDYDGYYGNQCWDLGQYYFTECLGLPDSILSGSGLVSNMLKEPKKSLLLQYFDEIPVTQMNPGDVVIWEYGHIAIFDHWDGNNNWYFSQNPNPSQVMQVNVGGLHAFRLKQKKEVAPNVKRNEYHNQINVKVEKLNVRVEPNTKAQSIGFAKKGIYDIFDVKENDNYKWYRIADNQWVAYKEEWFDIYPVKSDEDEIKKLKEQIVKLEEENKKLNDIIKSVKELVA